MQIVSGKYRHRKLETSPGETTRPITARVKVALFDRLQPHLAEARVADIFAGTGTIGLEALSRGAKSALLLERDKRAQAAITRNIQALGLSQKATLVKANCRQWSQTNPDAQFDLLLVDPPYHDLQLSTVTLLIRHLKNKGLMVLSYQGRGSVPTVNGVVVVRTILYGDAALAFYRKAA